MEIIKRNIGKILVIIAAFLTSTGQLFWKISNQEIIILFLGFVCYGVGSVLLIKSFTLEKLSIAYPLMSTSYIIALFYGFFLLDEELTFTKSCAVLLIFIGVSLTSYEN